jgi:hypothetical protein
MSDEQLRDLERRVQATPLDLVVGHELLRALERAGEAARAGEELVRLARLGSEEARRRLDRSKAPAPGGSDKGRRDGLARPESARVKEALVDRGEKYVVTGATDRAIVLVDGERMTTVDPVSLAPVRVLATKARLFGVSPRGPLLVDEHAIHFHAEGESVPQVIEFEGEPLGGRVFGEHMVLVEQLGKEYRLVAVDLTTGRRIWSDRIHRRSAHVALGQGRVFCCEVRTHRNAGGRPVPPSRLLEVRDITTGRVTWTRELDVRVAPLAADSFGFVFTGADGFVHFERDTARETPLDVAAREGSFELADDHFLVVTHERLVLLDRWSGKTLWAVLFETRGRTDYAVTREHVWIVALLYPDALEVDVYALEDGRRVAHWTRPLALRSPVHPRVIPFDGAVVVVVVAEQRILLLRFEEG